MAFVYILQSLKNESYYIGSTSNLERRLLEHNWGKTKSLKHLRPLKLVFKQEFSDTLIASRMERKLKSFKSRIILEEIINNKRIL